MAKNGVLEIRFNEDKTQAVATIHPSAPGGEEVSASDVVERLKGMGVTYGVREQAIRDAVHYVEETGMATTAVVAQGTLPQDGQEARIHYALPQEILSKPLPKRTDGLPDWFALETAKLVKAGQELVTVTPPQPGSPGKTLTWPIQTIAPRPGKPASIRAGDNVGTPDGLKYVAEQEGYVCLHNDTLTVYPVRLVEEALSIGDHTFTGGAVLTQCVQHASLQVAGVLAIRGVAKNCCFRVDGDVFLQYADGCEIIAGGNVYVMKALKNCRVNTRQKLIALENSVVVGGNICASSGAVAVEVGAPDFTPTEIEVGMDRFSEVRSREIEEEIAAAEANCARINQTLKPFASLAVHTQLPEDKRALVQRLQEQQRAQKTRINTLHNERRALAIAAKEKIAATVTVSHLAHPGVWINMHSAAYQVEEPLTAVRFIESVNGKSVQVEPL